MTFGGNIITKRIVFDVIDAWSGRDTLLFFSSENRHIKSFPLQSGDVMLVCCSKENRRSEGRLGRDSAVPVPALPGGHHRDKELLESLTETSRVVSEINKLERVPRPKRSCARIAT